MCCLWGQLAFIIAFTTPGQICEKINNGAEVHRIPSQEVPYAVSGTDWIGFDDEISLRNKVRFTLSLRNNVRFKPKSLE